MIFPTNQEAECEASHRAAHTAVLLMPAVRITWSQRAKLSLSWYSFNLRGSLGRHRASLTA